MTLALFFSGKYGKASISLTEILAHYLNMCAHVCLCVLLEQALDINLEKISVCFWWSMFSLLLAFFSVELL